MSGPVLSPSSHPQSQHWWEPLSASPGVERCVLCSVERFPYRSGWAYELPGVARDQLRRTEPPCGVRCPACSADFRAPDNGCKPIYASSQVCEVCKGVEMVPRGQSEIGAAGVG